MTNLTKHHAKALKAIAARCSKSHKLLHTTIRGELWISDGCMAINLGIIDAAETLMTLRHTSKNILTDKDVSESPLVDLILDRPDTFELTRIGLSVERDNATLLTGANATLVAVNKDYLDLVIEASKGASSPALTALRGTAHNAAVYVMRDDQCVGLVMPMRLDKIIDAGMLRVLANAATVTLEGTK